METIKPVPMDYCKITLGIEGNAIEGYNIYIKEGELPITIFGEGSSLAGAFEDFFFQIGEMYEDILLDELEISIVRN